MIQQILQAIKNWFQSGQPQGQTSEVIPRSPIGLGYSSALDSYLRIRKDRLQQLSDYKLMDAQCPEISHALNIYADNAVSGDEDGKTYTVEITQGKTPQLERDISEIEEETEIKEKLWGIARSLVQYGEHFAEPIIASRVGNYGGLVSVKPLPAHTMWLNLDDFGKPKDPEKYFQQRDETDQVIAAWPINQLIHWKIEGDLDSPYGRSILRPARPVWRRIHVADTSLVIARARRANMRYVYRYHLVAMTQQERFKTLEDIKKRHTTKRYVDRDTGLMRVEENPMRVEDDIFISKEDDVSTLNGDTNVTNIKDIEHLYNQLFTAIGVPKSFLNREQDVNSKATLTELRIQFARNVRRIQNALRAGLKRVYAIGLLSRGYSEAQLLNIKFDIVFPAVTAIDELIYWQTMLVKAQVAIMMKRDLGIFDEEYIYSKVFGLSADEFEEIRERLRKEAPTPLPVTPLAAIPAVRIPADADQPAESAQTDIDRIIEYLNAEPEAMEVFEDMRFLIEMNLEKVHGRERTLRSPRSLTDSRTSKAKGRQPNEAHL